MSFEEFESLLLAILVSMICTMANVALFCLNRSIRLIIAVRRGCYEADLPITGPKMKTWDYVPKTVRSLWVQRRWGSIALIGSLGTLLVINRQYHRDVMEYIQFCTLVTALACLVFFFAIFDYHGWQRGWRIECRLSDLRYCWCGDFDRHATASAASFIFILAILNGIVGALMYLTTL